MAVAEVLPNEPNQPEDFRSRLSRDILYSCCLVTIIYGTHVLLEFAIIAVFNPAHGYILKIIDYKLYIIDYYMY